MKKVKIYSTTTCPWCKKEKEFLDSKDVTYENVFVDEDDRAQEEMIAMSGTLGVPFTVITNEDGSTEAILGFDKEKLTEILSLV